MIGKKERLDLAIQKAKKQLIQNGVDSLQFPQEKTVKQEKNEFTAIKNESFAWKIDSC